MEQKNKDRHIIITGGAGFIGSALVARLLAEGYRDITVVDDLGSGPKWKNLASKGYLPIVPIRDFDDCPILPEDTVVHLGAESSTAAADVDQLLEVNTAATVRLFEDCRLAGARFIYASSAATYGDGSRGFEDSEDPEYLASLRPLNPYAWSKSRADQYIFADPAPEGVVGLKFFNVYGPNEYHKGSQSSVVPRFLDQWKRRGMVSLFASGRADIADGAQARDFVWVEDVVDVILFFIENPGLSGLYNVGSGEAKTFVDVVSALASALGLPVIPIEYVEMPEGLGDSYQYYTKADLTKLRQAGYTRPMTTLSEGVRRYVTEYLTKPDKYL